MEENGLKEGNLAIVDINGCQEVIFTCREIVVPVSNEHSNIITGNFTVIHYMPYTLQTTYIRILKGKTAQ